MRKTNKKPAPEKSATPALDYRYEASRKNLPPAGLAAQGRVQDAPKLRYAYDPHLPPALRFDPTGDSDRLPELLRIAQQRKLTAGETRLLAGALRCREPWLEWAGKRERKFFEVDPVALHIHERLSAQAILKLAARQDVQRDLFADPQQDYREAVQFYQHEVDWANRMILGDSLQVMTSLARREDLAGKVQMIYLDPPYGIKFASNFQPEVGKRDVKDKETDLTREPEMVKAYRDTWTLGVHSYLAYLRGRLIVARELLADSGSIFVQISDENLHRVRMVMDEVFGAEQFVSQISFSKAAGGLRAVGRVGAVLDYLLWYAKEPNLTKYRPVFEEKMSPTDSGYTLVDLPSGERRSLNASERNEQKALPHDARQFMSVLMTKPGPGSKFNVEYAGRTYNSGKRWWGTTPDGIKRVISANRIITTESSIRFVTYFDDFCARATTNLWNGLGGAADPIYVVQTNAEVIKRCLLMTTDPGDLVLDPTCGSGTTAYVAEQWGRRWITIDTSRVALALARQRLLTAKFDFYRLRPVNAEDAKRNPNGPWLADPLGQVQGPATLNCKTVPHITLKSIAQNTALDPIFAKHQVILDEKLAALNVALEQVTPALRKELAVKLALKEKREGKKSVTDADRRRWLLPDVGCAMRTDTAHNAHRAVTNSSTATDGARSAPYEGGWREWAVPFDTDPDWPRALQDALTAYRAAWRAKMDEVNAAIAANADTEELVDQPRIVKDVVRVTGPFTMEAVMPAEQSLDEPSPIEGGSESLETFGDAGAVTPSLALPHPSTPLRASQGGGNSMKDAPTNAEAYLNDMIHLLKADGVCFPNNKLMHFARLDPLASEFLHAKGEWANGDNGGDGGGPRRVVVSIGPQHGPVTAYQVERAIRRANKRGMDDLVFAGFSFDAAAQGAIQEEEGHSLGSARDADDGVRCHLAHIRPDVAMSGLLKETPNSQLFTVFGSPRARLEPVLSGAEGPAGDGQYVAHMEGVDIYNPVENTLLPTNADKVAAWFLDSDYYGRSFCVTQAFFPDKGAWDKLARALKGQIDEDRFAALSGTVSLPFAAGKHRRAAVKVIDPRGNEVMRVLRIGRDKRY